MAYHHPLLKSRSSSNAVWDGVLSLLEDYKSLIVPVAANIATSYNVCNVGYVMQIFRLEHPVPRWAAPAVASSCLCGAVIGQLVLGWLGDRFGRRPALIATLLLIIFGAGGGAIFTQGYGNYIWRSLVIWRFILGVGIGGTYPLTAVYAGEMQDERSMGRTRRVALSISIQIIGNILAPVLMFIVLLFLGSENVTLNQTSTEVAWRFLLGAGAVPALVALREIMYSQESSEFLSIRATGFRSRLSDVMRTLSSDAKIRQRFIGAAGGWMCFDICFFGVAIFLPHIIHDLIDKEDHGEGFLLLNSAVSALINCIAIPAVLLSMRLVSDDGLGRKNLQIVSFFLIMVSYALLMFFFSSLRSIQATTSVVFMFLILFFCLNFGAGMTTYILPQESFPPEVRSSLNGMAAAAGKIGAIVGTSTFAPSARMLGLGTTFGWCSLCALIGMIVTLVYVDDMRKEEGFDRIPDIPEVQRKL
uniref:Major facilitator superfamily (MFS) profile domain-containing protein n=1 Tax=Guillardia theta TaxID=55529 RepID=A0A6U5XVS8_GUITH|mmetsp:Transcript_18811/g.61763  ORF Transcript_18811/g.61763 Transcript_18811/m.61763 type:complete len:473 (+) Transcript_18811:97-1515(+)